ncbi:MULTISPECIES: VacJ family lipoprotein [unclassified Variovorax]|jgi:phospholipid-binding lipoprotein MlaA|uniref:MlaA family lipoprotein n=1 Tax=unclassified Variovorax TaxID=663243 RepID=UPI0008CAA647|nr:MULTISPECIES: VacJ family lipoprotein [unclassified Variovorax]SEJ06578.1 phospholipid-binding lipoprotein MlaA [Variovorax sp. OK202]SFB95385.1 phospholipid-binding lipoprotein MlaA [Variovorax sp. OK212]
MKNIAKFARWTSAAAVFALVAGCATGPNANPADPFEPFNRGVFTFNDKLDQAVLVPVSTAYVNVLPSMVRTGVNNFFGNIGDVWSFANSVAQLKLQNSAETFMRVNVNTFFGLGGLLDVATEAGIDRHDEDFGQTLGRWGVGAGPYIVLPLLGPSTLRDTVAKPVDFYGDGINAVSDVAWRNSLTVLRVVDTRSQYLRAGRLIDDAALDKYSFTRDAFLQRRRSLIHDGKSFDEDAGK